MIKICKKQVTILLKNVESYPRLNERKIEKNGVIHLVIHIIHKKKREKAVYISMYQNRCFVTLRQIIFYQLEKRLE